MGLLEIIFKDRLPNGKRKPSDRKVVNKANLYDYLKDMSPKKSLDDKTSYKKMTDSGKMMTIRNRGNRE